MAASQAERGRSGKAFQSGFPAGLAGDRGLGQEGKPYIGAQPNPEDFAQAKIPAFPARGRRHVFLRRARWQSHRCHESQRQWTGEFSDACEQGGPRIVVFNVAGIIKLKAALSIARPTSPSPATRAPGDGVCIAGNTVQLDTHDVGRHMRFRRGKTEAADRDDSLAVIPSATSRLITSRPRGVLDENISMYFHMFRPTGGKDSNSYGQRPFKTRSLPSRSTFITTRSVRPSAA